MRLVGLDCRRGKSALHATPMAAAIAQIAAEWADLTSRASPPRDLKKLTIDDLGLTILKQFCSSIVNHKL